MPSLSRLAIPLATLWLAASPARAASKEFQDLASGRYAVRVSGMLCHACAWAIVEELLAREEVEAAKYDYDQEHILVTVKLKRELSISSFKRALRRARARVNLPTRFEIEAIQYRP